MNKKQKESLQKSLFQSYEKIILNFPVCIKTKQNQYFRYYDDGRFEMINVTHENKSSCLTFGYIDRDYCDIEHSWLRILSSRHNVIPEIEYMNEFNRIISNGYESFSLGKDIHEKQLKENVSEIQSQLNESNVFNYDNTNNDPF